MSKTETKTTSKLLNFKTIEAPSLSQTIGEELFVVPELQDESFNSSVLISQRGAEPRIETVVGFSMSLAQIDSQSADSLQTLIDEGDTAKIEVLNLDMFTREELALAEADGRDARPSVSVKLDYAADGSGQIRIRAGIGLPVDTINDSAGKPRRSQFPNWNALAESGSNINEAFLRRVAMACFKSVSASNKELAKRMLEAMKPEEQAAPEPASSTTTGPSSLAGMAGTSL